MKAPEDAGAPGADVAAADESAAADGVDASLPDVLLSDTAAPDATELDVLTPDLATADLEPDTASLDMDAAEPDAAPDAALGGFGAPCTSGAQCESALCVDDGSGAGTQACTQQCTGTCPNPAWICGPFGSGAILACVPDSGELCKTCETQAECGQGYVCAAIGDTGVKHCTRSCANLECPAAYACKSVEGLVGCVPASGSCECLGAANGSSKACQITNAFGTCAGVSKCNGASGWSACSGQVPGIEVCNDLDDNCDGGIDEGLGPKACEFANAVGTCKGTVTCKGLLGLQCDAPAAVTETCNGEDDDCDGATDDGFADTDGDKTADCLDSDDDGDGVADAADNCPLAANPTQQDADKDSVGNACDPDMDNDGFANDIDCGELDPAIHMGAADACNGVDDNCNSVTDEGFADLDGDGEKDCIDHDIDNDGLANAVDNCPAAANVDQTDTDKDAKGDACDLDLDGDGVLNVSDNCALVVNADQTDTDKDGKGDACSTDKDGDGDADASDCEPLNAKVFHGAAELCNGIDDDCSGKPDDPFSAPVGGLGLVCEVGSGGCAITGVWACNAAMDGTVCVDASGSAIAVGLAAGVTCDDAQACTYGDVCSGGANSACVGLPIDCTATGGCLFCNGTSTCSIDAASCFIGGACRASGEHLSAPGAGDDACKVCAPEASQTAWSPASTARVCRFASIDCELSADATATVSLQDTCEADATCPDNDGTLNCKAPECHDMDCAATLAKLKCTFTIDDAEPCSDGIACSIGDACDGGVCVPSPVEKCDDANACTNDSCDGPTGLCSHVTNTDACSDGDLCTFADHCAFGSCLSTATDCDDANPCTSDSCDSATGACVHLALPDTATCDDGDFCTVSDTCTAGVCGGNATACCPYACGTSSQCLTSCSNDADCCAGNTCNFGKCEPPVP